MWKPLLMLFGTLAGCVYPPEQVSDTSTSIDSQSPAPDTAPIDTGTPDTGVPDSGTPDTGSDLPARPIPLECTDARPDLVLPELQTDADYHWRLVPLASPLLEDAWAIVIWPMEEISAYPEGLPVIVNVLIDTVLDTTYQTGPAPLTARSLGIVEVQPLPPGWTTLDATTSGELNYQGALSQEVARAAILWASGHETSEDGLTLSDVVERTTCGGRVVVSAQSSSGTTAIGALRPDRSPAYLSVAGLDLFESPSSPQFLAREGGVPFLDDDHEVDADGNGLGWDDARNLTYQVGDCDAVTCDMDYSDLRYEQGVTLADLWPTRMSVRFPGVLYLDRNQNGVLDRAKDGSPDLDGNGGYGEDEDFVFLGLIQAGQKARYSLELTNAIEENDLFSEMERPSFIPTLEDAIEWWSERSLSTDFQILAESMPSDALFSMTYTDWDHGVAIGSRPHIYQLAEIALENGVSVNLNTNREAASCVVSQDFLTGWVPSPPITSDLSEHEVQQWAFPEEVPQIRVRSAGIVGLFWNTFGPIGTCSY